MAAATPVDGGLLIPGTPRRDACDLILTPDGAVVRGAGLSVLLRWADVSRHPAGAPDGAWLVASWTSGRSGPIGIGIQVTGRYDEATAELRRRHHTARNRFNRLLRREATVPLCAIGHIRSLTDADRTVVDVLCRAMAERPEWQRRLGDPDRVHRLISDIVSQRHDPVPFRMGARRQTAEVLNALHLLGYEHRLSGGPLPDDPLPSLDDLASKILAKVQANPYAQDVHLDEATVRNLVDRHYLSIAPWPFSALVD